MVTESVTKLIAKLVPERLPPEKRVARLRAYLGTLVEATNDAVIGFDEEFNILS